MSTSTRTPTPLSVRITRAIRYIHALLGAVLFLFFLVILLNSFVATIYRVDGHSMDPTLHDTQLVGINLLAYSYQEPKRDDIVIIAYTGNRNVRFVKRILGVPGDTVTVRGYPVILKSDEYFIQGDNTEHSTDSRVFGPVPKSAILGKVLLLNDILHR